MGWVMACLVWGESAAILWATFKISNWGAKCRSAETLDWCYCRSRPIYHWYFDFFIFSSFFVRMKIFWCFDLICQNIFNYWKSNFKSSRFLVWLDWVCSGTFETFSRKDLRNLPHVYFLLVIKISYFRFSTFYLQCLFYFRLFNEAFRNNFRNWNRTPELVRCYSVFGIMCFFRCCHVTRNRHDIARVSWLLHFMGHIWSNWRTDDRWDYSKQH